MIPASPRGGSPARYHSHSHSHSSPVSVCREVRPVSGTAAETALSDHARNLALMTRIGATHCNPIPYGQHHWPAEQPGVDPVSKLAAAMLDCTLAYKPGREQSPYCVDERRGMSAPKWSRGMQRIGPGMYVSGNGRDLHFDAAEFCRAAGMPPTERNQQLAQDLAEREFRKAWTSISVTRVEDAE